MGNDKKIGDASIEPNTGHLRVLHYVVVSAQRERRKTQRKTTALISTPKGL